MDYAHLRLIRTLLFKLFWVQLAFLLVAWLLYISCKDTFYPWIMAHSGLSLSPGDMTKMVLMFFGLGKFILYCVYLVPGIAVHWTLRCLEKKPL